MNYIEIFERLWEHSENEIVEFKKAESNFDIDELGRYFSALSNEANLRECENAWIVFGVWDKDHKVVGTNFKNGEVALNKLKQDMSQHTTDNLIFREIVPVEIEGKRILLFKVPASPRNIVMCWKGIAYGRDGESLKPLNQAKRDAIRQQPPLPDWSAQLVPNATINDLDELAVATARVMFKKVHASNIPSAEVDSWSVEDFLAHSMMMRDGKLTRAAILLLGKPLSIQKIHPAVAQITWTWQDDEDIVLDYEHFTIPFILTVDKVLSKIRNKTMRELPGGTLFPDTMKQYDEYTIREALHNAIAHQDYSLQQRIVFVEGPDTLYYGNGGSFIPGTIENALEHKGPQFHYRNECLCRGMVNFNMIDTVGRGIKKIYTEQRNRFFPMPDYDIDNEKRTVGVTIYGKMIDDKYTSLLKREATLTLKECLWLDAVQKHRPITKEAVKHLRGKGLIEGRSPNFTISLSVAKMTHQIGNYTKEKGLVENSIKKLVLQLAYNAGKEGFKRRDVYDGLQHVFPSSNSYDEINRKIGRLLVKMSNEGLLIKSESGKLWQITYKGKQEFQD
ncbi:RNA-binding domain-containing protein [Prevotella sp. P2-180]|uniref:RNA-binding domain-containing protein n=1 Tax=Prevotella sp. P2-180 TaxID=2024224 RepID=UPI000B95D6D4|nr:RNA-binding domain-containing protein [Prevotella sp. P2-180]OYP66595.1 AAA family ATPase [Prevotella sp. P2-180]